MTEIKSDVKETVKAFIQTLVSIIVKEATKKMIKSLTEREKRKFESKIKDMSDDQLAQYLDKNPYFKNALENALKSLDYTQSANGTVSLIEKLQSIFEVNSTKKPISTLIWPAPHTIPAILVGIALLATIAVPTVFHNNTANNTTLHNNNANSLNNSTNITLLPIANFSSNVTNGSSPLTVQFNDSSKNANKWNWDFGDGNNSVEPNPVHTYFAKGNYTVNLTASNANGTNSTFENITVEQRTRSGLSPGGFSGGSMGGSSGGSMPDPEPPVLPVANFSTNITSGYAPLTVQFNDSSQNATSWSWNFGDGQTSSAQNPVNTYYSAGTYTVSLTASNADGYDISTKSNLITVYETTHTLTWNNPADITYGTALSRTQLNAVASVPGTFVYTPPAGTVLSAGAQTLHVAFTPYDTANYTNETAEVTINVKPVTPTIAWNNPANITYGTALSGTQSNAVASVPGTYVYTPSAETILNAGTQTLQVDFIPTDTTNYTAASKTVTINVTSAPSTIPIITWSNPADITYGTALGSSQLNAVASVPGTFVYTPAPGTLLSAGEGHNLHVDFTPTDTANYKAAAADVQINVYPATPTIDWSNPADIIYGEPLRDFGEEPQLNAVFKGIDGNQLPGTHTYTPAPGTILNAGTGQNLHVDFTPTDPNYKATSKDVQINVLQASPIITWNNPADIFYGTALSGTQLNAEANIAGTFNYAPAAGTVLSVGTHTLIATFTPTDTNYTTETASVSINVKPRYSVLT